MAESQKLNLGNKAPISKLANALNGSLQKLDCS